MSDTESDQGQEEKEQELGDIDPEYQKLCDTLGRRLDLKKRPRITPELLNALEQSQLPAAQQVRRHFTDARSLRLINVFQMSTGVLDIYRMFNERKNPKENKPKIAPKMAKMFLNEYSDDPAGFAKSTLDGYFSGFMRLGRILELEGYHDDKLREFPLNTVVGLLRFLVVEPVESSHKKDKGKDSFLHSLAPTDDVLKAVQNLGVTYKDELTADHAKQVRRNLLKIWVEKGMYEEDDQWIWPDLPSDKTPKVKEMLQGADYNSWKDIKDEFETEWDANEKKKEEAKADDYKGEAKAGEQSESKRSKPKSKTKKKDDDNEADPSAAAANLAAVGGGKPPARQTRNSKNKCSDPACPGYTFAECDLNLDYIPCDEDECKARFHSVCGKPVLRRCPAHAEQCIYPKCLVPDNDRITQHKCCKCGYLVHILCSQAVDPSTGKVDDTDLVCHRCGPAAKEVKSEPDQGQADMDTEEEAEAAGEQQVDPNLQVQVEFGNLPPAIKKALDDVVEKAQQDAARERERAEDLQRKLDAPVQDVKTQALLQEVKRMESEINALKSQEALVKQQQQFNGLNINLEELVKQQQEEIARLKAGKSAEAAIRRQLEQEIRGQLEKEHAVRQKQAQDAIAAQLQAERQKREEAERTIEQLRREAAAKAKEVQERQTAQLDAERKAREAAEFELKQLRLQVQGLRDVSLSPQVSRVIAAAQASMKDNRLPDSPSPSTPISRQSSMSTEEDDAKSTDDSQSTDDNNSQSSGGQPVAEIKAHKSKEQASLDYLGCALGNVTPLQQKWVDFYSASDEARWDTAALRYKGKPYFELSEGVKALIRKETTKKDPDDVGQQYYEKKYSDLSEQDRKWVDYYILSIVDKRELLAGRDYKKSFADLNRDEKSLVNQQISDKKRGLMPGTPQKDDDRPHRAPHPAKFLSVEQQQQSGPNKRKAPPSKETKEEPPKKKQRAEADPKANPSSQVQGQNQPE